MHPLRRPAAYLAELIGTFGLVLFIVLVLSVSAPAPGGLGGAGFAVVGLVHCSPSTRVRGPSVRHSRRLCPRRPVTSARPGRSPPLFLEKEPS